MIDAGTYWVDFDVKSVKFLCVVLSTLCAVVRDENKFLPCPEVCQSDIFGL
jgi:hypothetical protein